jgi:predicted ATP-dependent endonuclease of OLD family
MFIKSIEVKNFRSIKEQQLECEKLTALVGRNGSGKSSFLYAIEVFSDIAAPISLEDFFERITDSPIEIWVTFGDLSEDEKKEFRAYIKDDKLTVTKRISHEDDRIVQRYYAAVLQIPEFAKIRVVAGRRDCINAWNELVSSGTLPDLKSRAKSADEIDRLMSEYHSCPN